jgi:cytoskeletal protein RodZ
MSLGQILKAAREEKGMTLDDVEQVTRIRAHLLQALEEDNFSIFPSPVIARGMIRNYATYLELDPIEALTLYDGKGTVTVKGQRLTPHGIEFMNLSMTPHPIPWDIIVSLILFIIVVSLGGYLAYNQFMEQETIVGPTTDSPATPDLSQDQAFTLDTPTPLPTNTPTPVPPTGTPTPVVYTGVTVELLIRESSWVQITVDDVKAFEGILQTNESRLWTGERRVAIRSGNAGGIEVIVNGINRGLMGPAGQVADQVWEKVEDPATLPTQPK